MVHAASRIARNVLLATACIVGFAQTVCAQNNNPCQQVTNAAAIGQVLEAAGAGQPPPCSWANGGGGGGGGTGNAAAQVTTTFSATPTFTCPSATAGTSVEFQLSTALTASITSSMLSGCTPGSILSFQFIQGAGQYTVAMPSGFDKCTISPTNNQTTTCIYTWDGTLGHLSGVPATTDTPSISYAYAERADPGTGNCPGGGCWFPNSTTHDMRFRNSSDSLFDPVLTGVDISPYQGQVTGQHFSTIVNTPTTSDTDGISASATGICTGCQNAGNSEYAFSQTVQFNAGYPAAGQTVSVIIPITQLSSGGPTLTMKVDWCLTSQYTGPGAASGVCNGSTGTTMLTTAGNTPPTTSGAVYAGRLECDITGAASNAIYIVCFNNGGQVPAFTAVTNAPKIASVTAAAWTLYFTAKYGTGTASNYIIMNGMWPVVGKQYQ